jgi:hypothetical protein
MNTITYVSCIEACQMLVDYGFSLKQDETIQEQCDNQ